MKLKATVILFAFALSAHAQSFQNLNFEQANPVEAGGFIIDVTTTSALPDWQVYLGNVQQSVMWYQAISTGAAEVSLVGNPDPGAPFATALDGNYSVVIEAGGPGESTASITQTGLIPSSDQSLLFEAEPMFGAATGPLDVLIGNQLVPTVAVSTGPNYTVYGANLSAWANTTEPLTFLAPISDTGLNQWEIDDISFSQTAVTPEPSPLLLTGIGGLLFALHRRYLRR